MAGSQPGGFDALREFVDLSTFDNSNNNNNDFTFQASTLSPTTPSILSPPATLKSESSSGDNFTGPSHQYNLYKQQTGFVPGALHTALSMTSPHDFYQDYLNSQSNMGDMFDFNTPLDASGLDMDFQATSPENLFLDSTINPTVIGGQEPDTLTSPMPSNTSASGSYPRPWPGMHQQQAALRAQQQQRQQQQLQERQQAMAQQSKQSQKARSPQTSDSIAQQSVQHIMNAIRSEPVAPAPVKLPPNVNFPKKQKSEAEMDPDEKFLASEEAKKLDSRERRQLRNKVSARAFRSRRKEYITWLETQLSDMGNDNALLKAKNRALEEENLRLTALTRELLSAPQFQDYVSELASNPEKLARLASQQQNRPPPQTQQQLPRDMNPMQRAQHFQQQFQQQHQPCYAA